MRSTSFFLASAAGLVAFPAAVAAGDLKLPLPGKQLDCTRWPAMLDTVAPPNPQFSEMYDLRGIPDIPINRYAPDDDPCQVHLKTQPAGYCNTECGCTDLAPSRCVNPGDWAPTYDDGPSEFTPLVLNALKQHDDTKAMFFVIGSSVCRNPRILIDAVNAGHEIGVHTWSHTRLSALSNDQIIAEIKYTEKAIMELTGVRPKFMRPPYGNMDLRVKFILDKMGYTPVHWNVDTNDWKFNYSPDTPEVVTEATRSVVGSIQQHITENFPARLGTISLQHDIARIPASLASPVLDQIGYAGWKAVPISKCLNSASWFVTDDAPAGAPSGSSSSSAAKSISSAGSAAAAASSASPDAGAAPPAAKSTTPSSTSPAAANVVKSDVGRVVVSASSVAVVGSAVAIGIAL